MYGIVIYGVGSPIVVDFEESLARSELSVAAAVQNVPGEVYLLDKSSLIDPSKITSEIIAQPYLVPLFTPGNRLKAVQEAINQGFLKPYPLIDPSVTCPRSFEYGPGIFINSGCTLGAASQLDAWVFINRGVSLGHHVRLGSFVSIGPGVVIAAMVHIGKGTVIGAGAVVLPKVTIGTNAIVGAGSIVTKNVPNNCLVLGNPARIVKDNISGYNDMSVI